MKRKLFTAIVGIVAAVICGFGVLACDGDDSAHVHAFGTYYYNYNATCAKDGTESAKCMYCDAIMTRTKPNTATGKHDYGLFVYNNDATCGESGTETGTCQTCGEKYTRIKLGTATGLHDFWQYRYNNDATCVEDGTETGICRKCGKPDTRTKSGTALGHANLTYTSNNDATCVDDGTESAVCRICYWLFTRTVKGSATGVHTFEYVYNNDATCDADGTESGKCKYCEETDTRTAANTAGHVFTDYVYNDDATCDTDGTETAKCENCDETDTRTVANTAAHKFVDDICSVCGSERSLKFTEVLDGGKVVGYTVSGIGTIISEKVIIPSEHDGKPVVGIAGYAFENCKNITSVEIPYGVTSILFEAFYGCANLTSVNIPDSVTRIDNLAFWGCSKLTRITIPKSITEIGEHAFYGYNMTIYCEAAKKPSSWSSGWNNYSSSVVWDCKNNCKHSLIDSVYNDDETCETDGTETGKCEYCGFTYTQTVKNTATGHKFVDDICSVCGNARCLAFEEVKSGDEVVGYRVSGIGTIVSTDIVIPSEHNGKPVIGIWRNAFSQCSSITSVEIPYGVTSIAIEAFAYCTRLTKITIPNSVETIGPFAFRSCYNLTYVVIPQSVTSVGNLVFASCSNLTNIYCEAERPTTGWSSGWNADIPVVWDCYNNCNHSLTDYVYNDDATCETDGTETGTCPICGETLTQTASNTATGHHFVNDVCDACGSPRSLDYTEVLDGDEVIGYAVSGIGSIISADVVIPNEHNGKPVVSIGYAAFRNCTNLVSVDIPDSVTEIGECAFSDCKNLSSVTMRAVTDIGKNAFSFCKSLMGIEIPDSVKSIRAGAFYDTGLTSIEIPDSVTVIEERVFLVCKNLVSVKLPSGLQVIRTSLFAGCTSLKSIDIPDSVTYIGSTAFNDCGLTEIIIPDSVDTIMGGAFGHCPGLVSIVIPKTVLYLESEMFQGSDNLTTIYCEAESKPSGWSSGWNNHTTATVVWGYKQGLDLSCVD